MKCLFCGKVRSAVFFVAALSAAYFINVEVQSYFGRQALAETGLESVAFENALAKAADDGKLVLVDVSAIWCSTCRKLDSTVFSDTSVKEAINDKYVFSRIEYESEEGQRFLERYNASGFPTLFVIRPDGTVVKRLKVTFSPEEFRSQL